MTDAVTVAAITVRADRLVLKVQLAPDASRNTSPALAAALTAAVPTLPLHACVNQRGSTFGAVLADTSLPHVLEHLIIDAQTRAAAARGARDVSFVGTTVWTDEAAGLARVEVSYVDDVEALAAVSRATQTLNAICAAN